jgi:outer membrane immunogenic protein
MTLHRTLLLASAIGLGFAAPAFAQDGDTGQTYDGFYVGAFVGTSLDGKGSNRVVYDTNRNGSFDNPLLTSTGGVAVVGACPGYTTSTAPDNCRGNSNGLEYGIRLGVDGRMGSNLVVGVLLEGSRSNARDSISAFTTTPAGYSFRRDVDYAISARARAGFSPGDGRGLFYVTAGPSYARLNHDFYTTNTANSFTPTNDDDMVWGVQAGGGAEVMLGTGVSLGLEYLYNRYYDKKYYVAVAQGTAPATSPFILNGGGTNMRPSSTRYDFHSVRATLGFHF